MSRQIASGKTAAVGSTALRPGSTSTLPKGQTVRGSAVGHRLERITVLAPAQPTALASTAHHLPSPGPAAGAPIQLASWWKRGLAGLAAVGGGVAAGLGGAALAGAGIAMAPALALGLTIGGGAALLGGAGYLGYQAFKSRQRRQQRAPAQQPALSIDHAHAALRQDRDQLAGAEVGSRQELLHNILNEGLGLVGDHAELSPLQSQAHGGGDTQRIGGQRGRYEVRLSDDERDPTKRKSYLLHELIHASSDMSYPVNAGEGREFLNIPPPTEDVAWEGHEGGHGEQIVQIADQLHQLASGDPMLSEDQQRHIQGRAGYLGFTKPTRELDTVATDLLYYAHKEGIPEDSPTHQRIVALARAAYGRRLAARG